MVFAECLKKYLAKNPLPIKCLPSVEALASVKWSLPSVLEHNSGSV
jgi:hypothetical protein